MNSVTARYAVAAMVAAFLLVGCSRSTSGMPGASASPAPTAAAGPSAAPTPSTVTAPAAGTPAAAILSSTTTTNGSSAPVAPNPCALLTVDEIGKAYNTPFNAGQRQDTVDSQVSGARLHECAWQSTSNARGASIHLYLDVQTDADLAALPKDTNTIDKFVRSTSHFMTAKPTQVPGLTAGTALRNGANEIDVVFPGLLLRVSGDNPRVLPGLAAAAASRVAAAGGAHASAAATPVTTATSSPATASTASAPGSSDCEPGGSLQKINGVTVQVFCGGTASAQATFNEQKMSWAAGECGAVNNNKQFAIHIGTNLTIPSSSTADNVQVQKQFDYFQLFAPSQDVASTNPYKGDGTYKGDLYVRYHGTLIEGPATIIVSSGGKHGTFTGQAWTYALDTNAALTNKAQPLTGSWVC